MYHRIAQSQSNGDIFSVEVCFTQMTLRYCQVHINTTQHSSKHSLQLSYNYCLAQFKSLLFRLHPLNLSYGFYPGQNRSVISTLSQNLNRPLFPLILSSTQKNKQEISVLHPQIIPQHINTHTYMHIQEEDWANVGFHLDPVQCTCQ